MADIVSAEATALVAARRARNLLVENVDLVAKTGLMQTASAAYIKRPSTRPLTPEPRKREVAPATNDSRGGTKA